MTWIGTQRRWTKMYRGVRYYISAKELGCPPTHADSLGRANDWWIAKRAEIDGVPTGPGTTSATLKLLEAWAERPIETPEQAAVVMADMVSDPQSWPAGMETALLGAERVAQLRAGVQTVLSNEATPVERSLSALVSRWMEQQRSRVAIGKIGADRADQNRRCLFHFRDWLGGATPVEAITEGRLLDWHTHLSEQVAQGRWQIGYANRIWQTTKRFCRFLWELRLIELPRNLDNPNLAFTVSPVEISKGWTTDEVKSLWQVVRNQSRLHVGLMLNCGMTAKDINDLKQSEVDWKAGIITRKRSKTKKRERVPTVRYELWPEIFRLLKQWRSKDPEIVLLTSSGGRWILPHVKESGFTRSDSVRTALRVWMKKAEVSRPVSGLRTTAASLLGSHPAYKYYAEYFLGHSPRTVAERHYVKPTEQEFFEALRWLEGALGLE